MFRQRQNSCSVSTCIHSEVEHLLLVTNQVIVLELELLLHFVG